VAALIATACAVPPLRQVAAAGGTSLAGEAGYLGAEPWHLLVGGLLTGSLVLAHVRHLWARAYLGAVVGFVLVLLVLLRGAGNGLDLGQWYPLKTCWFLTVFLAPWLALTSTRLAAIVTRPIWRVLGRVPRRAFVLRSTVVAVGAALALVTWLPWQLGPVPDLIGAWQPYHRTSSGPANAARPLYMGGALDVATDYGQRFGDAVPVPYRVEQNALTDPFSTLIVSKLFAFQSGRPDIAGAESVCDAIRLAAGDLPAVVVTRMNPARMRGQMSTLGCPGRARVVPLTGAY
jgi:hypothetical protein